MLKKPFHEAVLKRKVGLKGAILAHACAQRIAQGFQTQKVQNAPASHLDPWQQQALDAIDAGHHVIIDAPTSAGKTRIIECYIQQQLDQGRFFRVIYTTPVKSLSNDKYRDFCHMYGKERVGINTGDFKENLEAPVVICTLETYRNSLLGVEPALPTAIVVYDEYHYLQDESRGSAWEESLILTPNDCQLLLMSASVPNTPAFARWIETLTSRSCQVISVTHRPVPLWDLVYTEQGWISLADVNLKPQEEKEIRQQTAAEKRRQPWHERNRGFDHLVPAVKEALRLNLGPLVIYASRRLSAESIARLLFKRLRLEDWGRKNWEQKIAPRVQDLLGWDYVPRELKHMILEQGIAFHHSGIIPPARMAIETLLKEGFLRICSGTMGISLGVNFAVRSALIADDSRPSSNGLVPYSSTEILQMLGRAGRRGFDSFGFSLWLDLGQSAQQKPKGRAPCTSSLKIDPATVLGLLGQNPSLEMLLAFYEKSFLKNKPLQRVKDIVKHLQKIKALQGAEPTAFGHCARNFPQVGGLVVAHWIVQGQMTGRNFKKYVLGMGAFCCAHFKEIPKDETHAVFLTSLNLEKTLDTFYPEHLFSEYYEPLRASPADEDNLSVTVFREFNLGAPSLIEQWLKPETTWAQLVGRRSSKHFSEGDCMMVLFRFATFLHSCARLASFDESLARQAHDMIGLVLRSPLDLCKG